MDYVRWDRLNLEPIGFPLFCRIEKIDLGLVGSEVLGFGILESKAGLICFKYPILRYRNARFLSLQVLFKSHSPCTR